MAIIVVVGILICYLVLAWFTGTWMHLAGSSLWILRGGLALIGFAGAGLFLWWYYKILRRGGAVASQAESGSDEMDALIRDALNRLRSSRQGVDLKQLPIVYVLGPNGATKTTTIVNSGLEPELLAGQVYQDNAILPTRSVNLWFTRQAMFVEAAGGLINQPLRWIRLLRKLQPARLSMAMSQRDQAPRGAVVCFDCETFLQPGASEGVPAMARNLNARLQEVSQQLGINFPVYVLFTKMDRVSFFADFVRNLSRDEASQVLGATLPMRNAATGVYAEDEARRLTKSFDDIFYALSEKRLDLLAREHDQQNLAGTYEFPREWRKLRTLLVQFLVELGRPSHLQANPFVRGFYFSGVRAVMVDDMAQAAAVSVPPEEAGGGATEMLSLAQVRAAAAQAAPARTLTQKKVPQWMFLTHLFNDVVLKDRAAMGASGFSSKVSVVRRILLAAAALICLVLALCFVVSFAGNRSLEADVTSAATGLSALQTAPGQLPALDELRRLEALRQSLETLTRYKREGAPWSTRWGLYAGDSLYPDAYRVYFTRFHQLMFGVTQQALLAHIQKLPAAPGANDNYGYTYDSLKAYLITTSNHDKSTKLFLAPVLMNRWLAGRELDGDRLALAQKQFDFYAAELAYENPFSPENDSLAVERARNYLGKFAAVERMYRSMLDEANRKNPSIFFNRQFPGSADAVIDSKEVEGAFSKNGFAFMQDAIGHSDRFFAGEEWVLGKQSYGAFDRAAVEQELRTRYRNDFIEQWRTFLKAAAVVRYGGAGDASRKLMLLSGNQSPLLALLWLASTNTAVSDNDIAGAFQPVQAVVTPGADRYVGQGNQGYMTALAALQAAMDQLAKSPGGMNDTNAVGQVRSSAMNATQSTLQLQQGFKVDQAGRVDITTAELLKAPIRSAEGVLRPPEPPTRGLCGQLAPTFNKFPFSPSSRADATFAEVNMAFQPGAGTLWMFYEQNLKNVLVRQGSGYVINPASGARVSPHFLAFFNRAVEFSEALYPGNSPTPNLRFTLRPYTVDGIQSLTFEMNSQKLVAPGSAKDFAWTGGDMNQVRVVGKLGGADLGILSYSGPWAVFHFFAEADKWQTSGNTHVVEWIPKSGQSAQPMIISGKPLTLRYDLQMAGAPVFNKAYLAGLRCAP
jgi:type VI secretion system protein ImpL